ncbi:hypothetical protein FOZ61_010828 [Perkinsus olseni]|uniref:Nucleoplasmin-like domain-containing protein n=1 Tax=Perkinsus olseni TaxID=32597 RepID=A0A7J6MK66_PEROL|nr:hypothetical protein FOZ61_010828 [Perkinsus olseni]KAF4671992.1 hypothetical protein FOL46_009669 [Perkinsus olseni]
MASPSPRLMKMFFGIALKGGESQTMDEVNADMVHLTQACLVSPKTDSRCEIQVKETEGESFTIAVLSKGSSNALSLDLTFSPADPPTFVNKGKEEVHLTGCYEFYDVEGESDEESEEEGSEVDEADMGEALNKQLTEMIKEKAKAQGLEVEDSEDEDEEDAKIEEVEEEDEEEEEEEESDVVEASPKKAESPKKPSPTKAESPKMPSPKKAEAPKAEKKRKLSADESSPKAAKPAKAAKKDGNKVEDDYAQSIVDYLTKNGRTNVGQLGSKCRKPASVSKLSNFLKSRPEFKLSNGFIELA